MLTEAQIQRYEDDGFLVLPGFSSQEEVAALLASGHELLNENFTSDSYSVFSTRNQEKKTDFYFLDSANNVSFFYEEKASKSEDSKSAAINKIGHAMHDLVPAFRLWTRENSKITALLRDLGYRRPLPVQSMYILKQPYVGGEVVPHQDSTFLATSPPSVIGFWLALEDATLENGCLWALPGSHKAGVHKQFIRAEDGSVSFTGANLPIEVLDDDDSCQFTPVEVKAGTLVLLHGANLHKSEENTSGKSRHAFSVHFVEGSEGVEYLKENWLQRREDFPFVPLYDDVDV